MNDLVVPTSIAIPLPAPRVSINVRIGTLDDLPFMDEMQKVYQKQLGFSPRKQIEGKIELGQVLVAEDVARASRPCSSEEERDMAETAMPRGERVGFCVFQDRYSGRDEVGIFYQVVVKPDTQRKLVGASLVKAAFERAAYGCKLFCCWCAQDIEANHFWESIGFVPLAFRTGNRKKQRTHIFWQKRIREGDVSTPYWFPSNTRAGMMGEGRLVIPIPPGTHWSDAKPVILPGEEQKKLETSPKIRTPKPRIEKEAKGMLSGWGFTPPKAVLEKARKSPRAPRPKVKIDPKYKAAARELRDRYLEHVNADPSALLSAGKYQVSRALEAPEMPLLAA